MIHVRIVAPARNFLLILVFLIRRWGLVLSIGPDHHMLCSERAARVLEDVAITAVKFSFSGATTIALLRRVTTLPAMGPSHILFCIEAPGSGPMLDGVLRINDWCVYSGINTLLLKMSLGS